MRPPAPSPMDHPLHAASLFKSIIITTGSANVDISVEIAWVVSECPYVLIHIYMYFIHNVVLANLKVNAKVIARVVNYCVYILI